MQMGVVKLIKITEEGKKREKLQAERDAKEGKKKEPKEKVYTYSDKDRTGYPYLVECEDCGFALGGHKKWVEVKYPWRYRCPKCGGKIIRTK